MSKTLYTASANLQKAVQEKAKKLGLEIQIENDYYWYKTTTGKKEPELWNTKVVEAYYSDYYSQFTLNDKLCPAIQEKQIKQILLAFQEVFKSKKMVKFWLKKAEEIVSFDPNTEEGIKKYRTLVFFMTDKKGEALCAKYLDGLEPMFDREPVKVLEELTEIINNL